MFGRDDINIEPFLSGIDNSSLNENIKEPTFLDKKDGISNDQSEKKEKVGNDKQIAEEKFLELNNNPDLKKPILKKKISKLIDIDSKENATDIDNKKEIKSHKENSLILDSLSKNENVQKKEKKAENKKLRKKIQTIENQDNDRNEEEKKNKIGNKTIKAEQKNKNKEANNDDKSDLPRFSEVMNNNIPLTPQKEAEKNQLSSDQVTVTNILKNPTSLKNVVDKYVENAKGTIDKLKKNMSNIMPRFKVKQEK